MIWTFFLIIYNIQFFFRVFFKCEQTILASGPPRYLLFVVTTVWYLNILLEHLLLVIIKIIILFLCSKRKDLFRKIFFWMLLGEPLLEHFFFFFFSILQIYKDSQFNNTKIKNSRYKHKTILKPWGNLILFSTRFVHIENT